MTFGDGADVGTPRFFDAREMGIANLGGAGWVGVTKDNMDQYNF